MSQDKKFLATDISADLLSRQEQEKREEVWLAGCCIPEPRMEWHYFHCGKDWR